MRDEKSPVRLKALSMKKIWIPIILLIMLFLFCLLTSANKFNKPIDYTLHQNGKTYIINGNFTNTDQPELIYKSLKENGISDINATIREFNGFLQDDGSLPVLEKIIPLFVKNYKHGNIVYRDKVLTVSGDVPDKSVKSDMDSLLADTKIKFLDNTKIVKPLPVHFSLIQSREGYALSGSFTNKLQLELLQRTCESTKKLNLVNATINSDLIDKEGAVDAATKIIPLFMEKYSNGKLIYEDRILTVSGKVDTPADKVLMKSHLSRVSSMTVVNNTIVDMAKVRAAQKAKEAAAQKAKIEAEQNAKEEAAQKAKLESEQKAKEEAAQKVTEEVSSKEKPKQETKNSEALKAEQDALTQQVHRLLQNHEIKFRYGSNRLKRSSKRTVYRIAKILKKYPMVHIEIAGHTDSVGSDEYNMKLSQARVDSVKKRLVRDGIEEGRMKSVGYGETKPLYPNTTRRNRRKNRRVEINVVGE